MDSFYAGEFQGCTGLSQKSHPFAAAIKQGPLVSRSTDGQRQPRKSSASANIQMAPAFQ
jgi:hypothetical protein